MSVRVRLAPSPTGNLHIGTARTALYNWLFAKKNSGKFLIRIEDTDKERSKDKFLADIIDGLNWLGLKWDEELFIQSSQISQHRSVIKKLIEKGLAYRCFATEKELEEMRTEQLRKGDPPKYDNRSRNLSTEEIQENISNGKSSVVRFKIDRNKLIRWEDMIKGEMQWTGDDLGGDLVISRRASGDEIGDPLYNLVVVLDDSSMNISHVIRGEDHIANTAKQILIYEALGINPPKFAHTPLILNEDGKKLSKRDGVTSIKEFKEMGYLPIALTNYMTLLGWSVKEGEEEIFDINDIYKVFNISKINTSGAKFDWAKLNWINSQIIKQLEPKSLLQKVLPFWKNNGWEIISEEWGLDLCKLIGPSLVTLKDCIDQSKEFFEEPKYSDDAISQINIDGGKDSLKEILNLISENSLTIQNVSIAKELVTKVSKKTNLKKGLIMKTLRAAFFGQLNGPDLLLSWCLLSSEKKDIKRIKKVLEEL